MTDLQAPLSAPGVGVRRKGPKALPRLPLSAFSPPNSGTSEKFPLPPSPSTVYPTSVVDGHLLATDGLASWKTDVGRSASRKINGVVLALPADSQPGAVDQIIKDHPSLKVLSVAVPVNLDQGPPAQVPTFGANVKVSLSVPLIKNTPQLVEGVKWALKKGYVVDIDVRTAVKDNGEGYEGIEELLSAVLESGEDNSGRTPTGSIVLSNILPPPHDLSISLVRLLNHPTYNAYQSSTATLSLFPSVYIKYTPPRWDAPVPATSTPTGDDGVSGGSKEKKEWKRRIKMYLGPAIEAFGYQRIIYGSSTAGDSTDWYELARESLAELGLDQDGLDAVFGTNASLVYGA